METQVNYLPGQASSRIKGAWFEGSTALRAGQGLCYNSNYGTATAVEGGRWNRVEVPSSSNNRAFAGVTVKAYNAVTGGQYVDIYLPGSVCPIAAGIDTTVNATYLTCSAASADAGVFTTAGFMGRGTALALQTITGGVIFDGRDGTGSVAVDGITLTDTGVGTASTAGDRVYVLAGSVTATGATAVTAMATTVASVTSANVVVLSDAVCSAVSVISYYTQSADAPPTVLAYLFDGEESGLTEWIPLIVTTSTAHMLGGITHVSAGVTIAADSAATLADGKYIGDRKGFQLHGAATTEDYLLTVTNGLKSADNGALSTCEFDADLDITTFWWNGAKWRAQSAGTAEA
jgi:hypothetical protein